MLRLQYHKCVWVLFHYPLSYLLQKVPLFYYFFVPSQKLFFNSFCKVMKHTLLSMLKYVIRFTLRMLSLIAAMFLFLFFWRNRFFLETPMEYEPIPLWCWFPHTFTESSWEFFYLYLIFDLCCIHFCVLFDSIYVPCGYMQYSFAGFAIILNLSVALKYCLGILIGQTWVSENLEDKFSFISR